MGATGGGGGATGGGGGGGGDAGTSYLLHFFRNGRHDPDPEVNVDAVGVIVQHARKLIQHFWRIKKKKKEKETFLG